MVTTAVLVAVSESIPNLRSAVFAALLTHTIDCINNKDTGLCFNSI